MFKKILMLIAVVTVVPMMIPTQIHAATPREIQYAHAFTRVRSRDAAIVPVYREIRETNAEARQLMDDYLAIVNHDRAEADRIYGQRLVVLAERDRLQRNKDRLLLNLELDIRTHLSNIFLYENRIVLLESTLEVQQTTLEHTILRNQHGMASEMDIRNAELDVEQTSLNIDMLTLSLQTARQNLNLLVHQPITADIRIVYDLQYPEAVTPLEELDERAFNRLVASHHNLAHWQDQAAIRRHDWQTQLDDPLVSNDYTRLQHQLAVLERDMAQRQAELAVRNAFAEWESILENGYVLENELTQAIADYEDMQNRLQAGIVTEAQVDAVRLLVKVAENDLAQHDYTIWVASLRMQHPYM